MSPSIPVLDTPIETPAPLRNASADEIRATFAMQQAHRWNCSAQSASVRIAALDRLRSEILATRQELFDAMWIDLHKSATEAEMSEIHPVLVEIGHTIKHLRHWMRPRKGSNADCHVRNAGRDSLGGEGRRPRDRAVELSVQPAHQSARGGHLGRQYRDLQAVGEDSERVAVHRSIDCEGLSSRRGRRLRGRRRGREGTFWHSPSTISSSPAARCSVESSWRPRRRT